jgi:hypothetical protein
METRLNELLAKTYGHMWDASGRIDPTPAIGVSPEVWKDLGFGELMYCKYHFHGQEFPLFVVHGLVGKSIALVYDAADSFSKEG